MAVSVSTAVDQKVDSRLALKLVATSVEPIFLTGATNEKWKGLAVSSP